jgi:hypothetical protein
MNDLVVNFGSYLTWARAQFDVYMCCVAFLATTKDGGDDAIGTAFHVGDGVFVTARHVVENRTISALNFNDTDAVLLDGPHFHRDPLVDVACLRTREIPREYIRLGGHLDDWIGGYEFVLRRTLILGYPPIPFSDRPVPVASLGEINATVDKYVGSKHPRFIVSTMARGGFSGAPVLFAYNEADAETSTAALGMVTESLTTDGRVAELGYLSVLTVEPIYVCLEQHGMLPKCQDLEA